MHTGTVTSFNAQAGVGKIAMDDGTTVTVSRGDIDGGGGQSLREGERVRFQLQQHPDGMAATHVYTL
ncbi:cold-shock protein [Pseudonocardia endophytica]|uniref:Cold shock CspA family protein n=1 Tax=Pseudonocardia endophytica TaxID=401976 RepID=A0A4R1HV89_PSEEN|nr:cold shock domain-containing protein [Pseudonocardia endophytica]TCK24600.1 cold shock CspA family protein [Pseudonocardia endophytica]